MSELKRYWYGWYMWLRAVRMARAKRRGAGKQKWEHAVKTAACYRYIVDGQFCTPPRTPRWLHRAFTNQ